MNSRLKLLLLLAGFLCGPPVAHAVTCTSTTNGGNWNLTGTWTGCTGGNGPVANTPGSQDTAVIATTGGNIVTANVVITVGAVIVNANAILVSTNTLTVDGTTAVSGIFGITNTTGTRTFTGDVTVNNGGTLIETVAEPITYSGNVVINTGGTLTENGAAAMSFAGKLQNDGTYTASTGVHTFSGASKTLSGTSVIAIPSVSVTGTYQNDGTLTVSTALSGAGTLTNGASATLNIGATAANLTLTGLAASATGNTVNYNGAAQTVKNPASATYYNLTLSGSGTKTLPGALTIDGTFTTAGTAAATATGIMDFNGNMVLGTGTTFNASSFSHTLRGNFTNNGATFTASTSTFNCDGSAQQTIGGTAASTFNNLTVNNANGVTLGQNVTVNAALTFSSGNITTGANTVIIPASGSVSRTSGHVEGNLRRNFATGTNVARTFDVGTGANYAPVSVTFAQVNTAGNLTATTVGADHPQIASARIDGTQDVNRYWRLTNAGIVFTTYAASFTYINGSPVDLDGGVTPANFIVQRYDGSAATWNNTVVAGTPTATSASITGVASLGAGSSEFALGHTKPASKLAFLQQPPNALTNATLTPAVTVQIQDSGGNVITTATNAVTIAIGTNPGGGTLNGTLTGNAVSGVAAFSGLSIDRGGTGYTLTASASGLTAATSATFTITNPLPTTTSITPSSTPVNTGGVSITITGTNFVGNSIARFGGVSTNVTTIFVSSTQLTAFLGSTLLTTAGNFNIDVVNPAPVTGGGTSNAQVFTVGIGLAGASAGATATGGANSLTLNVPAGTTTGNALLAQVSVRGGTGVTITAPAGWTLVDRQNSTTTLAQAAYRRVSTSGDTPGSPYTWNFSSSQRAAGAMLAYRDVNTATNGGVNVFGGLANASSTTVTAPAITTTVANTKLVGFFASADSRNTTWTTTMTTQVAAAVVPGATNTGVGLLSADQPRAAAGATGTSTATGTRAAVNIGQLIALTPGSPPPSIHHYELSLPTSSITCLPTTVTVVACGDASSPCTNKAITLSGQNATLATSSGTLNATTVTFNSNGDATVGGQPLTLSFPAATNATSVTVTLLGETAVAPNPRRCCPDGASCVVANSCSSTFNTAGFIVSPAAGGAQATSLELNGNNSLRAGASSSSFYLRAIRTNTTTKACEAALAGSYSVNFAYSCNDPSSCSSGSWMDVTPSPGSATAVPGSIGMTFDANGNAPFSFNYKDVGQVTLSASTTVNSAPLNGSSSAFVVKPFGFVLSDIAKTAVPNTPNPVAADAAGLKFVKAGEPFSATVTAVNASSDATPNYGKESSPETVKLSPSLVTGLGLTNNPALANDTAFGSFSSGAAIGTTFNWPEVGIITLTPSVGDADYLGAGDVTGTASNNVGRFYPDHFAVSGTGTLVPGCGTFTYLGQNLAISGVTMEAHKVGGGLTQNYAGNFAKLDPANASVWNLAARDTAGAGTALTVATGAGATSTGWSSGAVSVDFNLAINRTTPLGPLSSVKIGIAPKDLDDVVLDAFDFNSSGGAPDRKAIGSATEMRFGRLRAQNALASSGAIALPVPVDVQYWDGAASLFRTNTLDTCTTLAPASIGFNPIGTTSVQTITLGGGSGTIRLSPPGPAFRGSVVVTPDLSAAPYLQGAWTGSTWDQNPSATASWGVFGSQPRNFIFQRENY